MGSLSSMMVRYPPFHTRLEGMVYHHDGPELVRRVRLRTVVRIWQEGRWFELGRPGPQGIDAALAAAGVATDHICDVELWTPPVFCDRNGDPTTLWDNYYEGAKTVFLCLNGPGFDEEARALLSAHPGVATFAVNNGAHHFRPDLWACVDDPVRFMGSIWEDPKVKKFVPLKHLASPAMRGKPKLVRECPAVSGFSQNDHFRAETFLKEDTINWGNHKNRGGGRSVMLAALRIAWEMGFRRVVLVGCNFFMSEEEKYWFPEQRTKRAITNNQTSYRILTGFYTELLPIFADVGFSVVNATPGSHLKVFPMVDLAEEVKRAETDMGDSTDGMYR